MVDDMTKEVARGICKEMTSDVVCEEKVREMGEEMDKMSEEDKEGLRKKVMEMADETGMKGAMEGRMMKMMKEDEGMKSGKMGMMKGMMGEDMKGEMKEKMA